MKVILPQQHTRLSGWLSVSWQTRMLGWQEGMDLTKMRSFCTCGGCNEVVLCSGGECGSSLRAANDCPLPLSNSFSLKLQWMYMFSTCAGTGLVVICKVVCVCVYCTSGMMVVEVSLPLRHHSRWEYVFDFAEPLLWDKAVDLFGSAVWSISGFTVTTAAHWWSIRAVNSAALIENPLFSVSRVLL